jgi:hypothetical protein
MILRKVIAALRRLVGYRKVHTFTSTGTFEVSLSVDSARYLIIVEGGGGGKVGSGGGGGAA